MHKSILNHLRLVSSFICVILLISACDSNNSDDANEEITIGLNFEMTGDLPEVGKASRQAVEMYLDHLETSAGIEIGGITYRIVTNLLDNESTSEGAVSAASTLIEEEQVLAMIGPNPSNAAVPTGETANNLETVMISPWSSHVQTTLNRPWVFRVSFTDSFQGLALAQFANTQYNGVNACVLYAEDNAYPKGLAESFEAEWVNLNGTVAASETFQTGDDDLTPQLNTIKNAGCDFLFLPQYANEVPSIVAQAHDIGITAPILGGDAWASQTLLDECGADCDGYFLSKQFDVSGATGIADEFVDDYQATYGEVPDDVAALTWDAMLLTEQALKNCGAITGNLAADRTCFRNGLASIQNLETVTGPITFDENGDPTKCMNIIEIVDGEFTYSDKVCPD